MSPDADALSALEPTLARARAAIRSLGQDADETPAWRRDLEVLFGASALRWLLDVRRRPGSGGSHELEVTLGREAESTSLRLVPFGHHERPFAETKRLSLVQRDGGELSDAFGRELESIRHRVQASEATGVADALLARLDARTLPDPDEVRELASLPDLEDPEQRAVSVMLPEYARHYGERPRILERRFAEFTVVSVAFSDAHLSDDGSFFTLPPSLRVDAPSLLYLRRLGFGWNERGVVRQVPLPSHLERVLRGADLGGFGMRPRIVSLPTMAAFDRRWLASSTHAVLPINLGSRAFYLRHAWRYVPRLTRRPRSVGWLASHFTILAHDLGVHALPVHLLPSSVLLELGRRIRASWATTRWRALRPPRPLLSFYDTDLHLYARAAWSEAESVSELPAALCQPSRLAQLTAQLESRLREAAAAPAT